MAGKGFHFVSESEAAEWKDWKQEEEELARLKAEQERKREEARKREEERKQEEQRRERVRAEQEERQQKAERKKMKNGFFR